MQNENIVGRLKIVKLRYNNFLVGKNRQVRIWLPESYSKNKMYDTIYMLDGQRIFAPEDGFGEWKVDESISYLEKEIKIKPSIVVGIDNSMDRWEEYLPRFSPYAVDDLGYKSDTTFGFIIDVVIPYIEKNYSVYTSKEHRSFGGSSLGGLMAVEAAINFTDYFSSFYAFSPSFTVYKYGMREVPCNDKECEGNYKCIARVIKKLNSPAIKNKIKIAFSSGYDDGYEKYCYHNLKKMMNDLYQKGWTKSHLIAYFIDEGHNENQWSEAFYNAYQFINNKKKEG